MKRRSVLVAPPSGKVHLPFDSIVSGLPHGKDGQLRALAITSATRWALVPLSCRRWPSRACSAHRAALIHERKITAE